ncbi:MAG: hypothetical protein WD066_16860 [Planctomycetaceae bacterium]
MALYAARLSPRAQPESKYTRHVAANTFGFESNPKNLYGGRLLAVEEGHDPDGYLWEVAWGAFELREDGSLIIP